jgi:hypothetical protein
MDVSAGTGKDLQSITLALAKAQTGSLLVWAALVLPRRTPRARPDSLARRSPTT